MTNVVNQQPRKYKWVVNTYSEDFVRQFPSNTVLFKNNGLNTVVINDVYELLAGESLQLWGNQNELDVTIYKATFSGAGNKLSVWTKEDAGIEAILMPKIKYNKNLVRNKRKTDAAKSAARERKILNKRPFKDELPGNKKGGKLRRHDNTDF